MTWQRFTVTAVITNEGPAWGQFQIEYILREATLSGTRVTLHRRTIPGIGANQALTISDTLQIPPGLEGALIVCACGSTQKNQHLEYNEVNNDSRSVLVILTADNDGDAVPDPWEQTYGFDPLNPNDAEDDPDRDGFSNLQEYLAGTDPRSAASSPPRPTEPAIHRMRWAGNQLELHFLTDTGKTYQVQYRHDSSNSWLNLGGLVNGDGLVQVVVDPTAGSVAPRFYRPKVSFP